MMSHMHCWVSKQSRTVSRTALKIQWRLMSHHPVGILCRHGVVLSFCVHHIPHILHVMERFAAKRAGKLTGVVHLLEIIHSICHYMLPNCNG